MNRIKVFLSVVLILLISMFAFTGCIFDKKEDTKTNTTSVNETKVKEVNYSPYYELINTVTTGLINGFTQEQIQNLDVSVVFFQSYHKDKLGYIIKDIDGNGVNELIFGYLADSNDDKEIGCNNIVDIFTIKDGKLEHVLDGWERCYFRIRNDGVIACRGSGGASTYAYIYYEYKNDQLTRVEEVGKNYDIWYYSNERKPVYYKGRTAGLGEEDEMFTLQQITKEQGESIIAKNNHDFVFFEFTPFLSGSAQ